MDTLAFVSSVQGGRGLEIQAREKRGGNETTGIPALQSHAQHMGSPPIEFRSRVKHARAAIRVIPRPFAIFHTVPEGSHSRE